MCTFQLASLLWSKKCIYRSQRGRNRSEELGSPHAMAEGRKLKISAATKSYFSVLMADFTNSGVDARGEEQNEEIIEKTMKSNNVPQE